VIPGKTTVEVMGPAETSIKGDVTSTNKEEGCRSREKADGDGSAIVKELEPHKRVEKEDPACGSNGSEVNGRKCLRRMIRPEALTVIESENRPFER
jgi:hypothetical protein